ncbi:MAG: CDP-alcohol phosphatidyltransferase family protein [Chloroflexi bacterium]|nr:CDP-alcohol phosphatidyltransferase family protein [Chloroflexota bacterium]
MSLLPRALPEEFSRRLGETLGRLGISPNLLTIIGLLGSAGAATLAAYGEFWQAGLVMLAAGAFDLLDGAVARATGQDTTFGAILDAVSDRLAEFAMLLALLVWFSASEHFDREAIILIAVTISGSMLVSYTRSKAGEYGVRIREGFGTRFERVLILAIGLFANEVVAVLWILAVLTNVTALQRLGLTWWSLRGDDG